MYRSTCSMSSKLLLCLKSCRLQYPYVKAYWLEAFMFSNAAWVATASLLQLVVNY